MKKTVAGYLGFYAIVLVLVSFILVPDAKAQLLDRSLSLETLSSQLQSPDQILRYLWKNFLFEKDERLFGTEDYWQSPEEFLQNGKGDCEDFAQFAYALLKQQGVSAFLLNIYGDRFSHTVCMFKKDGKYQAIDSQDFKLYEAADLKGLIGQINSRWEKAALVQPSADTHRAKILAQFSKN